MSATRSYRRLHIGIITYELLPQTGTSARTLGFVRALTAKGHRVTLFGPTDDPAESALVRSLGADYFGVGGFRLTPGAARSFVYGVNIVRHLKEVDRRNKLDAIHVVEYTMNLLLYPIIKRVLGVPVVSDLHAQASAREIEPGLRRSLSRWVVYLTYEKLAIRFSDGILAPTHELLEYFIGRHGRRVFAVPNCAPDRQSEIGRSSSLGHEEKAGIRTEESRENIIFFHANFNLERAVREVLRLTDIVRELRARGFRIRLWVAGPASQKLRCQRDDSILILGYVKNPLDCLASSDLVILPLKDLTLGLHSRLVEAMTVGKPIIASQEACCGLLQYLPESGIMMSRTEGQMINAACSLLRDPNRMQALGRRNKRLAERLFSVAKVGQELEHAYLSVLLDTKQRQLIPTSNESKLPSCALGRDEAELASARTITENSPG